MVGKDRHACACLINFCVGRGWGPGLRTRLLNMAWCFASAEERAATRRSRDIDRYLKREKKRAESQLKILLLGPDESGKSMFWKQMRILYGGGWSEEHRLQQRPVIYSIVLNGMKEVLWCLKQFCIPLENPENEQNCSVFEDLRDWSGCDITTDVSFSSYVGPLVSLWRDQGIQEAAKRAGLYTLVSHVIIEHTLPQALELSHKFQKLMIVLYQRHHILHVTCTHTLVQNESFHYFMNNMDTIGQLVSAFVILVIITPRACARGKAIGLSVYRCRCRRCRHQNR